MLDQDAVAADGDGQGLAAVGFVGEAVDGAFVVADPLPGAVLVAPREGGVGDFDLANAVGVVDGVDAVAAGEDVGVVAGAAVEGVAVLAAVEFVIVGAAFEMVGTGVAGEGVGAGGAVEVVGVGSTTEDVVPFVAKDDAAGVVEVRPLLDDVAAGAIFVVAVLEFVGAMDFAGLPLPQDEGAQAVERGEGAEVLAGIFEARLPVMASG
jgi:hypothetical protein